MPRNLSAFAEHAYHKVLSNEVIAQAKTYRYLPRIIKELSRFKNTKITSIRMIQTKLHID
mgnify:CR=1 FL=1